MYVSIAMPTITIAAIILATPDNTFAPFDNAFAACDNAFAARDNAFAAFDNAFAAFDNAFAARDNAFAARDNAFAARDNAFAAHAIALPILHIGVFKLLCAAGSISFNYFMKQAKTAQLPGFSLKRGRKSSSRKTGGHNIGRVCTV